MRGTQIEAKLVAANHVLVALSEQRPELDFFGSVVTLEDLAHGGQSFAGRTVYLTGDISKINELELKDAARVFVIEKLSRDYGPEVELVALGRVPIRVADVGVYYRRFFADDHDLFHDICREHTFQSLTESVKPSTAHRTGLYLTPVTQHGSELHFHLLRCSTNLSGPTENFCANDRRIVDALNREAAAIFRNPQAPSRRLVVRSKDPDLAAFELPLCQGSVVAFTLDTNRQFTHAIALSAGARENDWLGITFRTSQTFVRFVEGHARLANGARLTIADEEQRRELFHLRRRENAETSFTYPPITYTISESDLIAPSEDSPH